MDEAALARAIAQRTEHLEWIGCGSRFAIVDDLLPPEWAATIHRAFLAEASLFTPRSSFRERKSTSSRFDEHAPILRAATFAFQNRELIAQIGDKLGIAPLDADPTFYAGGLSLMRRGDFLNPHIDNSHEATRSRYRRLNLLYYVTPDFPADEGGNLELWDDAVTSPITIHSRFNRLVLMETSRRSWHSVSPVTSPRARCCVSNYYFSPRSPDGGEYYHVTSFTGRPGQPFRRAVGIFDNAARGVARKMGARRASDAGYQNVVLG